MYLLIKIKYLLKNNKNILKNKNCCAIVMEIINRRKWHETK